MPDRQIVLVTGASQGIGAATARAFAAGGHAVVLAARDGAKLEALAAELGQGALAAPCDVTDPDSVEALFARIRAAHGRLDVVFNNAGASAPADARRRRQLAGLAAGAVGEPRRRLPGRRGGLPADARAAAAGRADHQQRLDLGARAALRLGALHRVQARDHRADPLAVARRPRLRHRLRPDRHRQRRLRHDREDGRRACRRPTAAWRRSRGSTSPTWRAPSCRWRRCRST